MWFASDNTQPAAPEVMAALAGANAGHAASYGADADMARVTAELRAVFEAPEAEVQLVATGTAANALALACLAPPWGAVYCHAEAHVNSDECGAPEFYTAGAKLVPLAGEHGRIDPAALDAALAIGRGASVHNVQPAALSLTNATEAGTVYDPDAVAALVALARPMRLPVHMDGARFANAVAGIGCSPSELSWKAGIDVLTLGGTKDGCLAAEAVIFFDPSRARDFGFRRKRAGHLFSKHRFLAAQIEAWLADGLWLELAARANARAAALGRGLAATPGVTLAHPVEANAVFARWPRGLHKAALAAGAEYHLWDFDATLDGPDDEPLLARLVCGWSTTEAEVATFLAVLSSEME
jgi:threonine aldolase